MSTKWREIGKVIALQVQLDQLKEKREGHQEKLYLPEGKIRRCESIQIRPQGVTAILDGQEVIDVHNEHHPRTRNRETNPVSFGLSAYYRQMQARFGEKVTLGVAGENILVETDELLTEDHLQHQVAFRAADGGLVVLKDLFAIPPCKPFTMFCLGDLRAAEGTLKENLQFLSGGTRGFCGIPIIPEAQTIHIGATMLLGTTD